MSMTYTLRYTDKTGRLIRTAMIPCKDTGEAVRASALTMKNSFAALEISLEDKVVWRGSNDRANVWAASREADPASSFPPSATLALLVACEAKASAAAKPLAAVNYERPPPLKETVPGGVLPLRF